MIRQCGVPDCTDEAMVRRGRRPIWVCLRHNRYHAYIADRLAAEAKIERWHRRRAV